jgi:hypothetical protein
MPLEIASHNLDISLPFIFLEYALLTIKLLINFGTRPTTAILFIFPTGPIVPVRLHVTRLGNTRYFATEEAIACANLELSLPVKLIAFIWLNIAPYNSCDVTGITL